MKKIKSLVDLIGNTPIVQAKNLDTGKCNLFLKMESLNPGSSIKDRVALRIIEDAEAQGKLKKGSTVVEATAGNTGLGLALIALLKGYKLHYVDEWTDVRGWLTIGEVWSWLRIVSEY